MRTGAEVFSMMFKFPTVRNLVVRLFKFPTVGSLVFLLFLLRGMMSAFLAVNAALTNAQQKALTLSTPGIIRVVYLSRVRVRFGTPAVDVEVCDSNKLHRLTNGGWFNDQRGK
jgi:hypothetical protein